MAGSSKQSSFSFLSGQAFAGDAKNLDEALSVWLQAYDIYTIDLSFCLVPGVTDRASDRERFDME